VAQVVLEVAYGDEKRSAYLRGIFRVLAQELQSLMLDHAKVKEALDEKSNGSQFEPDATVRYLRKLATELPECSQITWDDGTCLLLNQILEILSVTSN